MLESLIRLRGRLNWPGGQIPWAGLILLVAWTPLAWLPRLDGPGVVPFLCCFGVASAAYVWGIRRLSIETPSIKIIWVFAILFRATLLLTPATLSTDVYRYIWDGSLLKQGINPYAEIVQSPLLDPYTTPLRNMVDFPWMATPYLPVAQVYFAVVESIAPQNPFAFQASAAILDLAAGFWIVKTLHAVRIPTQAVLIYLWNPLVIVEFSHGAHVDSVMVFFVALALYGLVAHRRQSSLLSAAALAAGVLVKGWPILIAPVFLRRWGVKALLVFAMCVLVPLTLFAWSAGWGIVGPPDGRGVFGALRIYAAAWVFNSGLFFWLAQALGDAGARVFALLGPAAAGLLLGWLAWRLEMQQQTSHSLPPVDLSRKLLRWMVIPIGLYLVLAPTIHPWYLALVFSLLPYSWPAVEEVAPPKRWLWPWLYFMLFAAFTYLAYSGLEPPAGLVAVQTVAYIPFWFLLARAWLPEVRKMLDLSRI